MSRFPPNVRPWVKKYLQTRDGDKCAICGQTNLPLEIDHVNNNTHDDTPDNLRLLCHQCNCNQYQKYLEEQQKHPKEPGTNSNTPTEPNTQAEPQNNQTQQTHTQSTPSQTGLEASDEFSHTQVVHTSSPHLSMACRSWKLTG